MKGVSMGMMLTSVLMSFTGKLIAALGVGFVSYTGIDLLTEQILPHGYYSSWETSQPMPYRYFTLAVVESF